MVENCARCDIPGDKARLFDAIYEGKMSQLCERCSIIENIPIIKKPSTQQLKESEKSIEVYERMKRLSGFKEHKKQETFFREDRLKELEKNPRLELPEKEKLNLIEHFHWEIMKNRRRKGLSQGQLAKTLGESELAIDMLEKGKIPENSETLIRKLEQFFQINLRKITEAEEMILRKQKTERTKPVLLDEDGNELNHIPEPEFTKPEIEEEKIPPKRIIIVPRPIKEPENQEFEIKNSVVDETKEFKFGRPWRRGYTKTEPEKREFESPYLNKIKNLEQTSKNLKSSKDTSIDLNKIDITQTKIKDLKELHKRKIEVTKQERIEEQKKIEEKQRLIEARKEELRLIKEKESRNIDEILGGVELLGKKKLDNDFQKSIEEFDDELV